MRSHETPSGENAGATPATPPAAGLTRTGQDFLDWAVEYLEQQLGGVFTAVAEQAGEFWHRARPLALRAPRLQAPMDEWEIAGTPCEVPAAGSPLVIHSGVAARYPEDPHVRELQAESYAGVPLCEPSGRPLGHVALLFDRELTPGDEARAMATIQPLVPRLVAELSHRRLLEDFKDVVTASTLRPDSEPTQELLARLTRAMKVRAGIVGVRLTEEEPHCRAVAVVRDRQALDPFDYDASGPLGAMAWHLGPTADVLPAPLGATLRQHLAPFRPGFAVSVALLDRTGAPFGQLTLLHDSPLGQGFERSPLLQVVAARVAIEIERERRDRDRRTAERHALESQRLESLGMLAGGVAHDFNNLLVGVLGNAELCLDFLDEDHPACERLQQIIRAANSAAGLCHQLLDYAGSRRSQLRPQPVDQIAEGMTGLLSSICGRGISVDFQLNSAPMRAMADSAQLRQLLLNLVRNAADALQQGGGRITIRTRLRTVGDDEVHDHPSGKAVLAGDYIELAVADNGPGIPARLLPKVCEPFFTTRSTAHGLGLAAVDGILRVHKGALLVSSGVGQGARFAALLPLAQDRPARAQHGGAAGARGAGRVLVVDDSDLVRETTCGLLKAAGHRVAGAASGAGAVRLAADAVSADQPFSAAVIDLVMPGQDGVDTAISIRQHQPNLPVVLVTGFAAEHLTQRAGSVADAVLLTKPFRQAALLQAIADASRMGQPRDR